MPPKKKTQTAEIVDMDAKLAAELLGIRLAKEGEKGYQFTDENGIKQKFVMDKNKENRPFSLSLANDYKNQIIAGEWAGQWNSPSSTGNGESCVIDWNGNVVSMAHRGAAVWMAEQERKWLTKMAGDDPESPAALKLDTYGCNGEISFPTVLVKNVDPLSADTSDIGKNRNLSDVLFRREQVPDDWTESTTKQFATILSVAVKHVHLRVHGYHVKGAPKLHHPEAIKFLDFHPLLRDVCLFVLNENKPEGDIKRPLDRYQPSLGVIAASIYLAMYREANLEKYWAGDMKMDRTPSVATKDKAEEFWTLFGQIDNNGKKGTPAAVWSLKVSLDESQRDVKPLDRDGQCTVITRAMSEYLDGKKECTTNLLRRGIFNMKNEDQFTPEFERFGGLDVERDTLKELNLIEDIEVKRTKVDTWKVGDTAWVDSYKDAEELWYGKIEGFSDDGLVAKVVVAGPSAEGVAEEDLGPFRVAVEDLCVDKPEYTEEEEAEIEFVEA